MKTWSKLKFKPTAKANTNQSHPESIYNWSILIHLDTAWRNSWIGCCNNAVAKSPSITLQTVRMWQRLAWKYDPTASLKKNQVGSYFWYVFISQMLVVVAALPGKWLATLGLWDVGFPFATDGRKRLLPKLILQELQFLLLRVKYYTMHVIHIHKYMYLHIFDSHCS